MVACSVVVCFLSDSLSSDDLRVSAAFESLSFWPNRTKLSEKMIFVFPPPPTDPELHKRPKMYLKTTPLVAQSDTELINLNQIRGLFYGRFLQHLA